jgi:RNA polymerase sigma-70 factor (ECF subfamily)
MPQDLRETVALVLGEDMTHREAAEVLDLSEGTISWRMSEVRKILREIAKKEEML